MMDRRGSKALIGYARVSTAEQDTALQTDALREAGCERIFENTISGAKAERPSLASALEFLRDGDVLAAAGSGGALPAASDRNHLRAGSAGRRLPAADRKH